MEVKVFVDGVPRVVCGVTRETTCQEVVLALAQAQGQPGRYILREKFKDFERCMAPDERLLETLEKYGEQAKEVQLTLQSSGATLWDESGKKVGRYQPCPPLRRKEPGAKMRRGSESVILQRQSLPPSSCFRQEAEQKQSDPKRPKRKSLTLMEGAKEWLESLGKGKAYSTAGDKENRKKAEKKKRGSLDVLLNVHREGQRSKEKSSGSDLDHQPPRCIKKDEKKDARKSQTAEFDLGRPSFPTVEDEKNSLRETIVCQLLYLQDLQARTRQTEKDISELEEKLRSKRAEHEAEDQRAEEEQQQIRFWENELRAEEVYEKDLQRHFLDLKAKAAESKAKLEEYRCKIHSVDFCVGLSGVQEELPARSPPNDHLLPSAPDADLNRKPPPSEKPPQAQQPPNQIRERRLTGPKELKEWWTRWSETQNLQAETKTKTVHRSELTIYLGSTKV
ncbi:Ras association domain-containing protein 8 [Oryzias melastigma]|uniref:Ras association domain-containing protein 8 n=1 Tax=Oryzias melastigma TaxID=30732 RepID=A0A834F7Q8_ORYME|nr:Ras association domain-containing protein 8 [Oryzias melastigma]